MRVNRTIADVSRIANTCGRQTVIVIIIVVSVKCEQCDKSNANNKEFLSEIKHIFVFTLFAINKLIFKGF